MLKPLPWMALFSRLTQALAEQVEYGNSGRQIERVLANITKYMMLLTAVVELVPKSARSGAFVLSFDKP
ncbi:hypothetical protein JCM15831A_09120 [Asaia astilbis]